MKAQQFSHLLAARQGRRSFWLYVATLVLVIAGIFVGSLPIGLIPVSQALSHGASPEAIENAGLDLSPESLGISPALFLLLMLLPFVMGCIVLAWALQSLHRRAWKSMVHGSGRIRWRRIRTAFLLWILLSAGMELLNWALAPQSYHWNFQPAAFLPVLLVALLFLPFQTTFEELLFRGYLLQGVADGSRRPWVALLFTSLAFGLLHYENPEVARWGNITLVYYIGSGLFAGLITLLDDGAELAIGAHLANNLYSSLIVTFPDSAIPTPALFRVDSFDFNTMMLAWLFGELLFILVLWRMYRWRSPMRIFATLPPAQALPDSASA